MPLIVHRILCKILVKPFVWAHGQETQTFITRSIRSMWKAL